MANTHTLSVATTFSSLVNNASLADGDTIELAGYDLIVDGDYRSYGVTLTNGGTTAHLELRDGGGIKLNATLPSTIAPWVDPENPLPESNYTAGLTANASAEIQLNGNFSLGGAAASLPTATRSGKFWTHAAAYPSSTSVQFEEDLPLSANDYVLGITDYRQPYWFKVVSYDPATKTAELNKTIGYQVTGTPWAIHAGGVVIHTPSGYSKFVLSADMKAGTLNIVGENTSTSAGGIVSGTSLVADRVAYSPNASGTASGSNFSPIASGSKVFVGDFAAVRFASGDSTLSGVVADIGSGVVYLLNTGRGAVSTNNVISFHSGFIDAQIPSYSEALGAGLTLENVEVAGRSSRSFYMPVADESLYLSNCTIYGVATGTKYVLSGGTVTLSAIDGAPRGEAWYHAPASAAETTWRYTDYAVRAGAILRIAARWKAANAFAVGSVAITDCANWYAGTRGGALAEKIFDEGNTSTWDTAIIEWRNNSNEDRQVRVWECVTGSTQGGYLTSWEQSSGGPM